MAQKSIKNRPKSVPTPSWRGLGAILALGANKKPEEHEKNAEKSQKNRPKPSNMEPKIDKNRKQMTSKFDEFVE